MLSMALFVANDTLVKLTLTDFPLYQAMTLRGLAGAACLAVLIARAGQWRQGLRLFSAPMTLRSMAEFCSMSGFFFALLAVPIGDVTAIAQTSPLITVPLATLLLGERLKVWQIVLILAGFGGALLIAKPGGAGFNPAIGFAALSALSIATRDLLSRRVPQDMPFLLVGFSTLLVGALLSFAASFAEGWKPFTLEVVVAMVMGGALVAAGHTIIYQAYRLAPASVVSPFAYSATVWALLSGMIIFGERPDLLTLAGLGILLAAGVALAVIGHRGSR